MKKMLIIIGIIAVMLLAGCAEEGDGEGGTSDVYYGGSQGIIAEFEPMGLEENGHDTVWVGNDFPVEVTVKNKGEENIDPGALKVTIQGVDTSMFNIASAEKVNTVSLDKVSQYNPRGGEETISFGQAMLPDVTGLYYDGDFFASVEYLYKTYAAVPNVCFKGNYMDESVCNIEEDKNVASSGAPIVVTRAYQEPSGARRISVTFEIENVGGGQVAPPDQEFNTLRDRFNFQLVEGNSDDVTFTCVSAGNSQTGQFNDAKAEVVCRSSEIDGDALYKKQITLELAYKYKDLIQRTVKVRNEPN